MIHNVILTDGYYEDRYYHEVLFGGLDSFISDAGDLTYVDTCHNCCAPKVLTLWTSLEEIETATLQIVCEDCGQSSLYLMPQKQQMRIDLYPTQKIGTKEDLLYCISISGAIALTKLYDFFYNWGVPSSGRKMFLFWCVRHRHLFKTNLARNGTTFGKVVVDMHKNILRSIKGEVPKYPYTDCVLDYRALDRMCKTLRVEHIKIYKEKGIFSVSGYPVPITIPLELFDEEFLEKLLGVEEKTSVTIESGLKVAMIPIKHYSMFKSETSKETTCETCGAIVFRHELNEDKKCPICYGTIIDRTEETETLKKS